jgi:hypothetical protein
MYVPSVFFLNVQHLEGSDHAIVGVLYEYWFPEVSGKYESFWVRPSLSKALCFILLGRFDTFQ